MLVVCGYKLDWINGINGSYMATFVSCGEEGKEGEQGHSFRAWFTILDDQGRREKLLKLLMLMMLVSQ